MRILDGRVDAITFEEALERAATYIRSGRPHHIVTANTLMLLDTLCDPSLSAVMNDAALVLPESWGVGWASKRLGAPLQEIVPGIDFMLALCKQASKNAWPIYLLGAKPGIALAASLQLQQLYPGLVIAGTHSGYYDSKEESLLIKRIRESGAKLLFVGMNMPHQEKWIAKNLDILGVSVAMGVGGSFDVVSGNLRRAPVWMRRVGIEWVYRTFQQPWRLRRIKGLPIFMWQVLRKASGDS